MQLHPAVRIPLLLLAGMALGAGLFLLVAGLAAGTWGLVWRGGVATAIGVLAIGFARRISRDASRG